MRLSLALLLLLLCGCHDEIPDSMISAVVAAVAAADVLTVNRLRAGNRWRYYVTKRVKYFLNLDINYGLPPFTFLITRVGNETATLGSFVDFLFGTVDNPGPFAGGPDPASPTHTDLADVAKRRLMNDDTDAIEQKRLEFVQFRRQIVTGIIYRAAAIHRELWQATDTDLNPTLDNASLSILVDRRLRIVERMRYTDDAVGFPPDWQIQSATSGWTDNYRTVMFEYPYFDITPNLMAAIANAGLDITNLGNGFTYDADLGQLKWQKSGQLNPDAMPFFSSPDNGYSWQLSLPPVSTPADAFDKLIPSTSPVDIKFADFWQRNWLYCDPMIATLHLDALRFALARANGNDNQFNEAANQGILISSLISGGNQPDPTRLMTAGAALFDGALVKPSELQIGDHIIFWNSYFVRGVLGDVYGLENSVVADTDTEDPRQSQLAGHGVTMKTYVKFADGMVKLIKSQFTLVRQEIRKRYHHDNTTGYFDLTYGPRTFHIIRWDPYDGVDFQPADSDQLQAQGAWWIRIILAEMHDENGQVLTLPRGLQLFPQAVALRSTQTAPDTAPDSGPNFKQSIFLPLSRPNGIKGGWKAYFDAHDNNTNTDDAIDLDDIKVDSSWVLGFFYNGPASLIPVYRPKITS